MPQPRNSHKMQCLGMLALLSALIQIKSLRAAFSATWCPYMHLKLQSRSLVDVAKCHIKLGRNEKDVRLFL